MLRNMRGNLPGRLRGNLRRNARHSLAHERLRSQRQHNTCNNTLHFNSRSCQRCGHQAQFGGNVSNFCRVPVLPAALPFCSCGTARNKVTRVLSGFAISCRRCRRLLRSTRQRPRNDGPSVGNHAAKRPCSFRSHPAQPSGMASAKALLFNIFQAQYCFQKAQDRQLEAAPGRGTFPDMWAEL